MINITQVHGKSGAILINTKDCSAFTDSIDFGQSADSHDVTTFGATGHVFAGGLTDGKVALAGTYDNTSVTGPRAAVQSALGTVVAFKYRPEGIGTGKPESTFNVLVTSYNESVAVADMIKWKADLQISGAITTAAQ